MLPISITPTDRYSDWEKAVLCGVGRSVYGADIRFLSPAPASFATEVLRAAGLGADDANGLRAMLAAEHGN